MQVAILRVLTLNMAQRSDDGCQQAMGTKKTIVSNRDAILQFPMRWGPDVIAFQEAERCS